MKGRNMVETIVKLSNIKMVYNQRKPNEVKALSEINLEVISGDFIAIVGPSGSGKSTLLHIMGGILRPTSGNYEFFNNEVTKFSNKELASFRNKNVGFVLQDFGLLGERSVLENVCLPMLFSNVKWNEIEKKAVNILESLEINDLQNRKTNQLSGGQCQRVAIARALVMNPTLILADEPTGALDTDTSKHLMSLFKELNDRGITIVIVTHNKELSKSCKKIIQLNDGKISFDK